MCDKEDWQKQVLGFLKGTLLEKTITKLRQGSSPATLIPKSQLCNLGATSFVLPCLVAIVLSRHWGC